MLHRTRQLCGALFHVLVLLIELIQQQNLAQHPETREADHNNNPNGSVRHRHRSLHHRDQTGLQRRIFLPLDHRQLCCSHISLWKVLHPGLLNGQ